MKGGIGTVILMKGLEVKARSEGWGLSNQDGSWDESEGFPAALSAFSMKSLLFFGCVVNQLATNCLC